MARIETSVDYLKKDVAETKDSVKDMSIKFDLFLKAYEDAKSKDIEKYDARYASKDYEKLVKAAVVIILICFLGAIIWLIATNPTSLLHKAPVIIAPGLASKFIDRR